MSAHVYKITPLLHTLKKILYKFYKIIQKNIQNSATNNTYCNIYAESLWNLPSPQWINKINKSKPEFLYSKSSIESRKPCLSSQYLNEDRRLRSIFALLNSNHYTVRSNYHKEEEWKKIKASQEFQLNTCVTYISLFNKALIQNFNFINSLHGFSLKVDDCCPIYNRTK